MDDWDEVGRITFPAPGSTDYPQPVATVAFDTGQELLWTGNHRGCVTSFYSTELQRYTAFRIHPAEEGPVRQFLFHDKGVICLGPRGVHMANRRGLRIWNIRHEDMHDLHCMSFTSRGTTEILVAGMQDTMFVIDVNKGEIVKQLPTEHHYTIMKKSRYICAATPNGAVDLLDTISLKVIKTWQAHVAYINDMDAQNDFIVTCGGSPKQQATQTFMLDPYVNVFDLKNMTSLSPIAFPPLGAYVRMHPRMLTTSIVASQQGQMHVIDVLNPNTTTTNVRYANVLSFVNRVEMAASGEAVAIVDSECNIHLWGSPSKIHFADFPTPVEFPDPVEPEPALDWSVDTPLSSVGLPFYREKLLSAYPDNLISIVGAPPEPIDPAFVATLKQTEWGLYGRNTKATRKAVTEESRSLDRGSSESLGVPKFLSEKARESVLSSAAPSSLEPPAEIQAQSATDAPVANTELESTKAEAPALYQSLDIKYSKFGVDDFDFGYYNKTQYAGLENHITNAYVNSLIQLMNYTPLLRNLALQHAATSCLSDPCLLCELGFIFDMLQKAEGSTCQASNLLKALGNFPSLPPGLVGDDPPRTTLTNMIQQLTGFLFERICGEYRSIQPVSFTLEKRLFGLMDPVYPDELLAKVVATSALTAIKCMNCRKESTRAAPTFVNDLLYPTPKPPARGVRAPRITFSQVLKHSVERETTSKGWCSHCHRYQNLQTRKSIQTVPAVLALNTAIATNETRRLWTSPNWLPEEIGIIVDQGQFFCFEGEDLSLHLQRGIHNIAVYSLVGMVVNIQCAPPRKPHLVAVVNVAHSEPQAPSESRWHLFNDFSVRPISTAEALTFNEAWKMPSSVVYQLKIANNTSNMEWKTKLDTSVLFHDFSPHAEGKTYHVLEPGTENPGPDTIVALDTEFVSLKQPEIQLNSDGESETIRPMSHALARVSVVRGQGEYEGWAFIDDYVAIREPIVDYLTLYSGITPGDLDPRTSRHNLVSLKVAYKKLWVLLNLGCKFLGHGLKQDFRVINIQVPKAQIIDTIDLFFLKNRLRKLSLAFLAWYLLKEDIQLETHDSIEDARTALKLYRKYLEFDDAGILETMLQDIYRAGRETNFKPQRRDDLVVQRTDTPPIPIEGGPGLRPSTPLRRTGGVGAGGNGVGGQAQGGGLGPGTPAWTPGKGSPLRE